MMKHWRVGSLSMGLLLVATGILMLVSMVVRVNVLDVMLTFWPLVLICLGAEILLHLFVKKNDEGARLRYDVLSILFISVLLIISVGFYGVTYYIGLFDSRDDFYEHHGVRNDSAHIEETLTLSGTKELVFFSDFDNITVLSSTDGELRVSYTAAVNTSDEEYAKAMLADIVKLDRGERAYLRIDNALFRYDRKVGWPLVDVVIYLPPDVTLDLSQHWGAIEIDSAVSEQAILSRD